MGNSGLRGIESFGSASVVDARGPRDSDYLINQRPELARSPAADRIRHGLIVMREHNWPVALASFQYALQLDADNASIKELEVQAQRMVDRKKETAAGPVTPLAVAIHSASRGDNANAIRQFELVKAENPAIAAQADSMIAALRQRQKADASGVVRWNQDIVKADA